MSVLNSKMSSAVQHFEKELNSPEYILGPGDKILIEFRNLIKYSGIYLVDNQGFIDLPELNLQNVKDKTISELRLYLLEKYAEFLYSPQIKIKLHSSRPIKVTLRGEVFTNGLFILNSKRISNQSGDIFSETTIRFISIELIKNSLILVSPFLIFVFLYLIFFFKLTFNFKKQ